MFEKSIYGKVAIFFWVAQVLLESSKHGHISSIMMRKLHKDNVLENKLLGAFVVSGFLESASAEFIRKQPSVRSNVDGVSKGNSSDEYNTFSARVC